MTIENAKFFKQSSINVAKRKLELVNKAHEALFEAYKNDTMNTLLGELYEKSYQVVDAAEKELEEAENESLDSILKRIA